MMNLVCVGEFAPNDGMKLAVWAFTILKYVAPQLQLVLVGDGPQRKRIENFARAVGAEDIRVQFWTDRSPDEGLEQADIVWGIRPCGGTAILKAALDRGTPTLAVITADTVRVPGLILVPPNDPVALAIATRKVLAELAPRPSAGVGLLNAEVGANGKWSEMY